MTDKNSNSIDGWIDTARQFVNDGAVARHADIASQGTPRAALIAASDFPIDPTMLTGAAPGEIYDIRNVAGLVPPSAGEGIDRSMGAALEFAVNVYGARHIILLAHPNCGLVRSLIDEDAPGAATVAQGQFIPSWTMIAASALSRALARVDLPQDDRAQLCCQEIMRVSFENLMTYQWILDPVFDGRLTLHGWYCDARNGVFAHFDPATDEFVRET
jgi:carbonic anhydrase